MSEPQTSPMPPVGTESESESDSVDPVGDDIAHHVLWRRRLLVAIVAVSAAIVGIVIAIAVLAVGNSTPPRTVPAAAPAIETTTAPATTTTTRPASSTTTSTTTTTAAAPATQAAPPPAGTTSYVYPLVPASQGKYARSHHDYPASDMFASCGTPFVSPVAGVVEDVSRADTWNSKTNDGATRGGISVSVVGGDGVRYYGSHLQSVEAGINPGVRVSAGTPLGKVGETGSARGTGCHLHFGISPPTGPGDWEVRRGAVYPWPYLDSWRAGGQKSPVEEIR